MYNFSRRRKITKFWKKGKQFYCEDRKSNLKENDCKTDKCSQFDPKHAYAHNFNRFFENVSNKQSISTKCRI